MRPDHREAPLPAGPQKTTCMDVQRDSSCQSWDELRGRFVQCSGTSSGLLPSGVLPVLHTSGFGAPGAFEVAGQK